MTRPQAVAFADPQTIAVLLWSLLALRQHSHALLLKALDAARVTAFRLPAQLCLVAEVGAEAAARAAGGAVSEPSRSPLLQAALMLQLELPDAPPLPAEIVRTAGQLWAKSHFLAAEAAHGTAQAPGATLREVSGARTAGLESAALRRRAAAAGLGLPYA